MKYLRPGGRLLYSTCSLLSDENEKQVRHFVKEHRLAIQNDKFFQSPPVTGGSDGFFSAVLYRKDSPPGHRAPVLDVEGVHDEGDDAESQKQ